VCSSSHHTKQSHNAHTHTHTHTHTHAHTHRDTHTYTHTRIHIQNTRAEYLQKMDASTHLLGLDHKACMGMTGTRKHQLEVRVLVNIAPHNLVVVVVVCELTIQLRTTASTRCTFVPGCLCPLPLPPSAARGPPQTEGGRERCSHPAACLTGGRQWWPEHPWPAHRVSVHSSKRNVSSKCSHPAACLTGGRQWWPEHPWPAHRDSVHSSKRNVSSKCSHPAACLTGGHQWWPEHPWPAHRVSVHSKSIVGLETTMEFLMQQQSLPL